VRTRFKKPLLRFLDPLTWQNDSRQMKAIEDFQLGHVIALANRVQDLDELLEVEEAVTVRVHQPERALGLQPALRDHGRKGRPLFSWISLVSQQGDQTGQISSRY
jgi:hypothetical protein